MAQDGDPERYQYAARRSTVMPAPYPTKPPLPLQRTRFHRAKFSPSRTRRPMCYIFLVITMLVCACAWKWGREEAGTEHNTAPKGASCLSWGQGLTRSTLPSTGIILCSLQHSSIVAEQSSSMNYTTCLLDVGRGALSTYGQYH